jgi:hypothetical protein
MSLCLVGGHELQPVDDATLLLWSPQVYVITRTAEHGDAIHKGLARVHHVKALLPNTRIGVRWWPDDKQSSPGSEHYKSPQQYAADYFKLHVPGTLLMPDNEAAADELDPRVFMQTVAWWETVTRLATAVGVTLGIGCTPLGVPDYPQYRLLVPLYQAMQDAALKGVVHWKRPNAYFVPSDPGHHFHYSERHQREERKVCKNAGLPFPPFFLGEFAPIRSYIDAEAGPRQFMGGAEAARAVIGECNQDEEPAVPRAYYCLGDGIYDNKWRHFNGVGYPGFLDTLIRECPRVPDEANAMIETLYVQRAKASVMPSDWKAYQFTPQGSESVNVRAAQSTGSTPIVAQIPPAGGAGELDVAHVKPPNVTAVNFWYHVRFPNPQGIVVEGWVRSDTLLTPVEIVPEVDPAPPLFVPALEWDPEGKISRSDLAAYHLAMHNLLLHGVQVVN